MVLRHVIIMESPDILHGTTKLSGYYKIDKSVLLGADEPKNAREHSKINLTYELQNQMLIDLVDSLGSELSVDDIRYLITLSSKDISEFKQFKELTKLVNIDTLKDLVTMYKTYKRLEEN